MADEPSAQVKGKGEPPKVGPSAGDDLPNEQKGTRRAIPGNLPYLTTPKRLGDALKGIVAAERPPKFNEDFLGSVLQIRGGSARPIPAVLKRMGLLNADNSPAELYSKFKSDSSRPNAALQALRNGYAEVFKRNEYAHKETDDRLKDIIVEITGLPKPDPIVSQMASTFAVFREYAKGADETQAAPARQTPTIEGDASPSTSARNSSTGFNLVNTVNVVLPETTDVQVYNAIFRAIRENLMP